MKITKKIAKKFLENKGYYVKTVMEVEEFGVNVSITYETSNPEESFFIGCMSYLKIDIEEFYKLYREKKLKRILKDEEK